MNSSSLASRSSFRFAAAALLCASFAGARAAAASSAEPAKIEIPIVSVDEAVQKELLNLDRLLDANPKLEEKLRNNLDQLTQETFRAQNPDVDALLRKQPNLVRALRTERHFFVHRAIARLARSRVMRNDAAALDTFLTEHPDIEKALQRRPSQIVEADFLIAHPALGHFFEAHPALSSVLLQQSDKRAKAAAQKK